MVPESFDNIFVLAGNSDILSLANDWSSQHGGDSRTCRSSANQRWDSSQCVHQVPGRYQTDTEQHLLKET